VKGTGEKGEATVGYKAAVAAVEKAAEDALDDSDIPLERRSLVRDYFDRIRPGDVPAPSKSAEKKK